MGRAWDDAVDREFRAELIDGIEKLKKDCEVSEAWDIKEEVGKFTIELIQTTYQDI